MIAWGFFIAMLRMERARRPWQFQPLYQLQQQQEWRRLAAVSGVIVAIPVVLAAVLEVAYWRHDHAATTVAVGSVIGGGSAHIVTAISTWRAAIDALLAAMALVRLLLVVTITISMTDEQRGQVPVDQTQRLLLIDEEEDTQELATSADDSASSPYDRAGLLSRLSYGWISPIIRLGTTRRLEMSDVPELPRTDSTFTAADKFRHALADEKRQYTSYAGNDADSPSFLRLARKLYGWDVAVFALWSTGNKLLGLAGPLLLKLFLDWADRPDSTDNLATGYALALLMALRSLLSAISSTQYGLAWKRFDLRVRAGLLSAIYDRTLHLNRAVPTATEAETGNNGVGKITNLLSVDVGRVVGMPGALFDAFLIPLEIVLALALLHSTVSFAFIAGLVLLAVMLPVQTLLGGTIQRVTREMLRFRDSRVSAAAECVRGIRALKLLAWDSLFLDKMAALRSKEMGRLAVRKYLDALCVFFWASTPVVVQTAVFATLILLLHQDLSAANAFTAIALLDRLIFPMNYFPWIINGFLEARVSALRIRAFLFDVTEEFDQDEEEDGSLLQHWETTGFTQQAAPVAEIRNAVFEWATSTTATVGVVLDHTQAEHQDDDDDDAWELASAPLLDAEHESEVTTASSVTSSTSAALPVALNFSLRIDHLTLQPNTMYIVCGRVGAGKSSMLHALLGEMPLLRGFLHVSSGGNSRSQRSQRSVLRPRISFAPQTPWLMNASVRQNVTLCDDDDLKDKVTSIDEERYARVLRACQLERELRERGSERAAEQGSNFSGGQRARIALARALYHQAPLYLLDDPLSGLDTNTARAVLAECFTRTARGSRGSEWSTNGAIPRGATVVMVTHALHLLEQFAQRSENVQVIVMDDARIAEMGAFVELQAQQDSQLSAMLRETASHAHASDDADGAASSEGGVHVGSAVDESGDNRTSATSQDEQHPQADAAKSDKQAAENASWTEKREEDEEFRHAGSVHWNVWRAYAAAIGWPVSLALLVAVVAMQTSRNALDWWIARFTGSNHKISPHTFAVVLLAITGGNLIAVLLRSFLFALGGLRAANRTYAALVSSVFSAALSFFDATPAGRVLNRLSGDTYTVDESLPFTLNIFIKDLADVIGAIVIVMYGNWLVGVVLVPLAVVYRVLQRDYRPSSRHVKRLDAVAQSPLLARLTETLDGLRVIRALKLQRAFSRAYVRRVHASQRTAFLGANTGAWFGLRLDMLGVCVTSFVALSAVVDHHTGGGSSSSSTMGNAGMLGLTLTYALPIVGKLNSALNNFIDTERQMIAVERVCEYAALPSEDAEVAPPSPSADAGVDVAVLPPPSSQWPARGHILVTDLTVRYDRHVFQRPSDTTSDDIDSERIRSLPTTPTALSGVSFEVNPGERVGICGRTGAGKSTLLRALFRAVRWDRAGSIRIDGVPLDALPLRTLRSHLSYVPQDVVLFAGTIRSNLDPEGKFRDDELWAALARCGGLDTAVSRLVGGLNASIGGGDGASEGGKSSGGSGGDDDDVLSKGQRQLLCVARALLRPSKVLCVDEATSSMDPATERAVNEVRLSGAHRALSMFGFYSDTNALRLLLLPRRRSRERSRARRCS